MANTAGHDRRGPKLGDAASLWNFTPSPGWTKEEAAILKLCLMKYGVGRWVQILDTGLLPGKLIQQLNGQTQRLLGQQSLAAVTGLHVDIDRIREDNSKRTDVERKGGLIIWSGPNPTGEMKSQWQREAKAKYGLTPEQKAQAEEELEELAANLRPQEPLPLISLMDTDVSALSREQKVQLLGRLRKKLHSLALSLAAQPGMAAEQQQGDGGVNAAIAVPAEAPAPSRDEDVPAEQQPKPTNRKISGNNKTAAKKSKAGTKAAPRPASDDEADDSSARKRKARGKGLRTGPGRFESRSSAARKEPCSADDSIAQLQAMGFSKAKAKAALEECEGDVTSAVEWLAANLA
ncbi:hypothetical protein WJX73_001961 [Symbiochloris irregularis]|uniref:UBA domain-containing protein n=1 Tax=Symbiochloris irregularis TaxID=706552 RepID=A0AAW1PB27_9CHLO